MARSAHLRSANDYSSRASTGRRVRNLGAEHENLDQKAYQILKSMIIERQLLPGDKIPQEKLAEDLGINAFYGGHYATETFGVQALASELSRKFGIPWSFVDHPSGL